jgi:hypothetical protein
MHKTVVSSVVIRALRKRIKRVFGFRDFSDVRNELLLLRKEQDEAIPKIELERKHIKNVKILFDREELLSQMPKDSVCAEIGVNRGEFSQKILSIVHPKTLHLIDAWGDPTRYHDELKVEVRNRFKEEIASEQVIVDVGFSTDILKTFPDHYFDWVYLDTDHTYKTTKDELDILKTKVKLNGVIAGHDYTLGNWVTGFRYGVVEAVHELCVKDDWELVYLTNETHQCRNFAIKKLL